MFKYSFFLCFCLLFQCNLAFAQQSVRMTALPTVTVWADQHLKGDTDLYGLGDWHVEANTRFTNAGMEVDVDIVFCENANDMTTLSGFASVFVPLSAAELAAMSGQQSGVAHGKNIGARGMRRFEAAGLIDHVELCTDTFGDDLGRVGGKVVFRPLYYLDDSVADDAQRTAAARPLPIFVQ